MSTQAKAITLVESARTKAGSLRLATVVMFNDYRRKYDQSSLERFLGRTIVTANAHKAKGRESGDPMFVSLYEEAQSRISSFSNKWNIPRQTIEAQVPALQELHALTIPQKRMSAGSKLLALILGGGITLFVAGFSTGIIQAGYSTAIHLLHVH